MILLDTHILVWLDQDVESLGTRCRSIIASAHKKEQIFLSAISFWELGMLIEQGRLSLAMALVDWRVEMLAAGFNEIEIDGKIATSAARLQRFHGDPADRLIVTTAMIHELELVTADKRILDYRPARTISGRS